jgi:hypothetical protein
VTQGGERFSPKGAYNFLLTLLTNTKERLKYSKLFKEQVLLELIVHWSFKGAVWGHVHVGIY